MKKFFFMAATAALALSSCSSDELVQTPEVNAQEGAVSFSAYSGRQTRAFPADEASTLALKGVGFGVFGYEQGDNTFSTYMGGHVTPNFMYNQLVSGKVKDWNLQASLTNEEYASASDASTYYEGTADAHTLKAPFTPIADATFKALSPELQKFGTVNSFESSGWIYDPVKYWSNNPGAKHSFFAYAPYKADMNASNTNPKVVLSTLYEGPALEYTWSLNDQQDILCASAYLDRTKPAFSVIDQETNDDTDANSKGIMKFQFSHALSKVSFNIQTWVDQKTDRQAGSPHDDATTAIDPRTQIWVKSIKMNGKFAQSGILKLVDGTWSTLSAETQSIELLQDKFLVNGDGKEHEIAGLQDILFIPLDGAERFTITIVYDVITGTGLNQSIVTNTITSTGEGYALAQNTAYEYHLNLGMETVKFAAEACDWAGKTQTEVDLPANN